jgi:phage shock protein A
MELHTNATQARRYVHRPKTQMESYRHRVELAKEAARCGYGWEDIRAKYMLDESDARQIVWSIHDLRKQEP